MIIVGLILCPISIAVVIQLNKFSIKKSIKIGLQIYLWLSSLLYVISCFIFKIEPFNFEILSAGDYFISFAVIFVFSPCLWVLLYYYCQKIFKGMRVRKNARIRSNEEYIYYRDNLDKIPPSIVMFTSIMETDIKKSVAAVILKLKLNGYIQEMNHQLQYTHKDDSQLLESEKLVLKSVQYQNLNEKLYKELVEKEALHDKYVKKNNKGKVFKLLKIFITLIMPIIFIGLSIQFDEYVFAHYKTYIYDSIRYVSVQDGQIGDIHYDNIDNIDDYYHGYVEIDNQKRIFYDKALIRADKFDNEFVLMTAFFQILDAICLVGSIMMSFVMAFMAIEQVMYFNKNYIRTIKGVELLNKAYALKNFLNEFSLMKERTEEELILWEYYLIYAIVLDVNVKIKDDIIEKYYMFS